MFKHLLAAFSLLLLTNLSAAQDSNTNIAFKPYKITYKAKIEGFKVTATRSLEKLTSNQYKLTQKAKASMMKLTESTVFELHNNQAINTLNYNYERKVVGFGKKYSINFSNQAQNATYKEKKTTKALSSNGQTLFSLLSYQSEIRRRLITGNTNLELPIISKGRIRSYTFNIAGEETLKTDLGNIDCIKIVRKRQRKQKETTIWLAKNWQYNIVKIEHKEENAIKYQLNIKDGSVGGKTIKG